MSDDIVDRLNITADMIGLGDKIRYGSDSAIMREAANEIEKLRAELAEYIAQAERGHQTMVAESCELRKETHKLRAALKPFAATAEWDVSGTEHDDDLFRPILPPYNRAPVLRVIHLRAAKAALGESDD